MNKKEVLEIKRRFKKESATFQRLAWCYVDADHQKVCQYNGQFLTLEEEELFKFLDMANKALSGTLGNNLLELSFPLAEEEAGGRQQVLMALRGSGLTDEGLLDAYYDHIIETYEHPGNYLIVLFHDTYDVMKRTSDQNNLDESEEVYDYLICAICPVSLSKPGLGYLESEQRIGSRIRDWVVGVPDTAFLFPAFCDRSTDIHSVLFYTRNTKEPHAEFMEQGLGCDPAQTATEQKMAFHSIIRNALGAEEEQTEQVLWNIQKNLNDMVEEYDDIHEEETEPLLLDLETVGKLMSETNIPKPQASQIEKEFGAAFKDKPPAAGNVIDQKALQAQAIAQEKLDLEYQVRVLSDELDEKKQALDTYESETKTYDVILRVRPEKASQIHSQMIDGKRCLVIPMDENEHAAVNGVHTLV